MSHEVDMAAGIPLPKSVMGTPAQSPYSPPSRSWLNEPFSSSPEPQGLRLSSIEVVPPTPPPRTGRRKLPRDVPTRINEDGIVVMGEESVSSPISLDYTIGSPLATPRNLKMSVNTPTATPRQRVMNRMSRTFHAGTPPPAIRMLHPDDASRHAPISATFHRDPNNKRSSIISMSGQSNKRQSVFSVQGASALQHELERQQRQQQEREQQTPRHGGKRPHMEHKETGTSETLSPEMARGERSRSHSQQSHATSGGHTWHTSDSSGSNQDSTVPAKMMRVDPLTVLERRRRRDFTIGSHNPLHGPPNTPNETPRRGVSMAESDLSEV
ncbi:hypothetical protein CPB86DRAFT_144743 [Serendipita vermifera]|nr:hypothetical protein CPB86DRAFT_144743 [Serendipita vermifera]